MWLANLPQVYKDQHEMVAASFSSSGSDRKHRSVVVQLYFTSEFGACCSPLTCASIGSSDTGFQNIVGSFGMDKVPPQSRTPEFIHLFFHPSSTFPEDFIKVLSFLINLLKVKPALAVTEPPPLYGGNDRTPAWLFKKAY